MSPDGNYLAYVLNSGGNESLWLRHLASESNVQIIPPEHVQYSALRFSPDGDGRRFAFIRANDPDPGKYHLLIANADGSNEKSIFTAPMANVATDSAWSLDGKAIVGTIFDQAEDSIGAVISIDPETGAQRTISRPPDTVLTNVS